MPGVCGQSALLETLLTLELQDSRRLKGAMALYGCWCLFLSKSCLGSPTEHVASTWLNSAGLATQAGFDYKSPGILWDMYTKIPSVVGAVAALAKALVPVIFLPVGSCSP